MLDLKNLARAIEQVAEEKGVDAARVLEAVESSIAAAYKKEYEKRGELIKAKLNLKTGEMKFWQVKTVEDETTVDMTKIEEEAAPETEGVKEGAKREVRPEPAPAPAEPVYDAEGNLIEKLPRYNPDRHMLLDEAKKVKKDAKLGDELEFLLEPREDFGRIAAQTAKQVILQRLREAERDSILKEFHDREGEVVSGLVQRLERGNVYIDLGRTTGVMFYNETIPTEHYRVGGGLRL